MSEGDTSWQPEGGGDMSGSPPPSYEAAQGLYYQSEPIQQPAFASAQPQQPAFTVNAQHPDMAPPVARGNPVYVVRQQPPQHPFMQTWHDDIFACGNDCGNFVLALFCLAIVEFQNATRARILSSTGAAFCILVPGLAFYFLYAMMMSNNFRHRNRNCGYYEDCGPSAASIAMSILLFVVCAIVFLSVRVWLRARIRFKYGIFDNPCNDCVLVWFCAPCAAAQSARHIAHQRMATPTPAPQPSVAVGYQQEQRMMQTPLLGQQHALG